MIRPNWKWLVEAPLPAAWRRRLDILAGVVLTGTVVIGLAGAIRPDPEKLAALKGIPLLISTPAPVLDPSGPAFTPTQANDFMNAVQVGNVTAMREAYRIGMPLENTLAMAAQTGHSDAILWLLARGANPHDNEHTASAPILAADDYPDIVSLLRRRGAAEPTLESCALENAPNAFARVFSAHPERAKEPGILHAAAATTNGTIAHKREMVLRLLDAGADVNMIFGTSPLGGAASACEGKPTNDADCMSIVQLLLDRGAKVTGEALASALSLDDSNRRAVLDVMLGHPIEKGVTSTALATASPVASDDLKRIVKEEGVDWNWHDGEDDAAVPLLAAIRRGDRDLARDMIQAGAPVDVHYKDGSCALAEAIDDSRNDADHARIVELLVAKGADVNRRFPDGRTPLYAAAEGGEIRVVNFLLDHGARVNDLVLDDTALDGAEGMANTPAARIIAAHGGHRGFKNYGRMGM